MEADSGVGGQAAVPKRSPALLALGALEEDKRDRTLQEQCRTKRDTTLCSWRWGPGMWGSDQAMHRVSGVLSALNACPSTSPVVRQLLV